MAVSSMDPTNDWISGYSNYCYRRQKDPMYVTSPGWGIDVAAPGDGIFSTFKDSGYETRDGTSAAAPHVGGLVALYIAANGRATNAEGVYRIRQAIVDSGQPQSQWNPVVDPSCPTCGTLDFDGHPEPLAVPSENWVPAPRILSQSLTSNSFDFSFTTVPGYLYTPQFTDSLSASNQWSDLPAANGTGSPVLVSDPVLNAIRYYRIKRGPAP